VAGCFFICRQPLVLASGSPRRREFLAALGLDFTVAPAGVDERPRPAEAAPAYVERLCAAKAAEVGRRFPEAWVLAADTAVVVDGRILGKPDGQDGAAAMLLDLRGRAHEVWTGFCLARPGCGRPRARSVRTTVRFADFPDAVFEAYAATGDGLDKAGAYGIQSLGGVLVEEISGSYSNVVGLPLSEVVAELLAGGVITPRVS